MRIRKEKPTFSHIHFYNFEVFYKLRFFNLKQKQQQQQNRNKSEFNNNKKLTELHEENVLPSAISSPLGPLRTTSEERTGWGRTSQTPGISINEETSFHK